MDVAKALIDYLSLVIEKARHDKGSAGSGHWGHAGRTTQRGGSVAANIAMSARTGESAKQRQSLKKMAAARGGKSAAYQRVPESMNTIPTVYEIANKGAWAAWKYPMSLSKEDGIGSIMRGRNGKYYAYKRSYAFEVEPIETGENDTVVIYEVSL